MQNNGNVGAIANNITAARSQSFTYDELNRIATAKTQATSGQYCWGETFSYDPWGNLLAIGAIAPQYNGCTQESLSVTATLKNQISGFCYDAAGNLLIEGPCGPTLTYQYDAENRMTTTAGVTYTYDGDGRRVKKSNGTLYWYGASGLDALLETDLAGNTPTEFVFFGGKRIARRDSGGAISYFFADHLGSSRVVTNATGTTVLDDSDFYPFGRERVVVNNDPNQYKFTGKERDSESGLDSFGFRYNSSSLGRFMSPDPFMATGRVENPQTWNRYTYALNNPLRFIDPFGLFASPAFNCTETNKNCLNDQQREILNNSTVEINGKKLSGEALYNALNEKQQNAFVNVTDRLASIKFEDGTTALSAVKSVTSFEPDRIKATVDSSLAGKIEGDSRFRQVSGALHPGFDAISFKSRDTQGNIQFSFNKSRTGADIDHDLYQDPIRHGLEVIFNRARQRLGMNGKTDQDAVRRLLIARPEVAITPSPDPQFNRPQ